MSKICYERGYFYIIQYHIVRYVVYRHDNHILIRQVDKYVKDLLNLIADDKALYILDVETHNDYVHLQIESTEEQIRRYIQDQKKK